MNEQETFNNWRKISYFIVRRVTVGVGMALINTYYNLPIEVLVGAIVVLVTIMPEDAV